MSCATSVVALLDRVVPDDETAEDVRASFRSEDTASRLVGEDSLERARTLLVLRTLGAGSSLDVGVLSLGFSPSGLLAARFAELLLPVVLIVTQSFARQFGARHNKLLGCDYTRVSLTARVATGFALRRACLARSREPACFKVSRQSLVH